MDTGAALRAVDEGLDALLASGFDPADTAQAAELIRRVEVAGRRMHAAQVELLATIDAKGLHRHDGHASAKVMVRHVANLSNAEAARRAQSAAVLQDLPEAAAAHRRGELGTCQVGRLGRLHANRRVRQTMPISEAHLLKWAANQPFKHFDELVGAWERRVDEDGAGDRESRHHAGRNASWLQNFDGSWTLTGLSPSLSGAEINDILGHFTRLEWQKDWAEARARLGETATEADLRRTDAQRRHDALLAMCRQAASTVPGPTQGGGIVTNIVIDHHTLQRQLAKLAGHDPGPVDPHDPSWRCSTIDGAPIDPTSAALAALFGEVRRVVIGADSTVIDLGRRRLFTGGAALAVRLTNNECMWPGCHVPVSDCHTDHLQPWPQGGDTNPRNGAPMCPRHNLFKHNAQWRTWRDARGQWHLQRPDGTTVEGPQPTPPHRNTDTETGRVPPDPADTAAPHTGRAPPPDDDESGLAAG